jgi:parallel beta-helix repeat protein
MNKPVKLSLAMSIVLLGLFVVTFETREAAASGTVYIRADGEVYPSNAPIQRQGNVYTLTDNINESIVVQRSNVVVDGAGTYALTGPDDYESIGIALTDRQNVTIQNFKGIEAFGYGLLLNTSSNIRVRGNTVQLNNRGGVYLYEATNNSIFENTMTLNMNYDIKLHHASSNDVRKNHLRRILLEYSSNNNSIYANDIHVSGQEGVGFSWSANNNKIYENNITGGLYGVRAFYASSQRVRGNTITDAVYGLHFDNSANNIINQNTVSNTTTAIFVHSSSENTIFHNNFVQFDKDASVTDSHLNLWDKGYPGGGNYWSNYTGVDADHDGIGDAPHVLDAENSDNYPLVGVSSSFNTSRGTPVHVVSNSSVEAFAYFASNSTIKMHVINMTDPQAYGFCRMTLPHDVLPPPYTVMIGYGIIPHTTLFDNDTVSIIYFSYPHSERDIIITPELPALTIMPFFMTATLLAALMYKRQKA